MKKITFFAVTVFCCLMVIISCTDQIGNEKGVTTSPTRDGIFIHVSHGSEDPHRVLMALNMAVIMSEDRDVYLYFDIKGVEVLLKESADLSYSHFPSSHTQIKTLLEKNVPIVACPGCLKAAGKSPEDLMPGIAVANKDQFFNFTSGRILTLDY
jgi:predicted peroxiredoxin